MANDLCLCCCCVTYCGSYDLLQAEILIKGSPKECPSGSALPHGCGRRRSPTRPQCNCGTHRNAFPSQDRVVLGLARPRAPSFIREPPGGLGPAGEDQGVPCLMARLSVQWGPDRKHTSPNLFVHLLSASSRHHGGSGDPGDMA